MEFKNPTEKKSSFIAENAGHYIVSLPATVYLPADADNGATIKIKCSTADSVSIIADSADFIRFGILDSSLGGSMTNTNKGNCITLQYFKDENCWYGDSSQGAWSILNGETYTINNSIDNVQ